MRVHRVTDASTGDSTDIAFTPEEEAASDAADAIADTEATRLASFATDPARSAIMQQLRNATAAQIRSYVANNVTDLASARAMLANILILIALDARQ